MNCTNSGGLTAGVCFSTQTVNGALVTIVSAANVASMVLGDAARPFAEKGKK